MRDELLMPQARSGRRKIAATGWARILGQINFHELLPILYFCAAGLLMTAAFIRMFPNFGEMVESLALFP